VTVKLHLDPRQLRRRAAGNFHIESLPNFDGPLVGGNSLTFEYQGDRNGMAIPKEPTGALGFHNRGQSIDEVTWSDRLGEATFQRGSCCAQYLPSLTALHTGPPSRLWHLAAIIAQGAVGRFKIWQTR
jgi:hypothetical protein